MVKDDAYKQERSKAINEALKSTPAQISMMRRVLKERTEGRG